LLAWVLWDCLVDDDMGKEVWHDPAFKVYRGIGNLVLLLLCWGVDVHVWKRAGIDYERFLRLPPAPPGSDPTAPVWNIGLDLAIAFLLSLICFWKALRGVFLSGVPPQLAHAFPVSLFLYVGYRAVTPWVHRKFVWKAVGEVLVAPWGKTAFKEGFVGDVLTSTVRPLIDVAFSILYFLSGVSGWYSSQLEPSRDVVGSTKLFQFLVALITVLPLWLRFAQNLQRAHETRERWPHLGNAMKYATAMMVGLYGLNHKNAKSSPIWIASFVFATLYQYTWDIFMDWDLVRFEPPSRSTKRKSSFRPGAKGHKGLLGGWRVVWRRPLLYHRPGVYLAIAVANLGLRFFWTLSLIPEGGEEAWQKTIQVRLSPVLAGAEICRRCVWSFLRLENEHLHAYGTAIDDLFTPEQARLSNLEDFEPMSIQADGGGAKGQSDRAPVLRTAATAAGAHKQHSGYDPLPLAEKDSSRPLGRLSTTPPLSKGPGGVQGGGGDSEGAAGQHDQLPPSSLFGGSGLDQRSLEGDSLQGGSTGSGGGSGGSDEESFTGDLEAYGGGRAAEEHGAPGGQVLRCLGFAIPSSTANLTNFQVLLELSLLAAAVASAGTVVAFGI